METIDNNWVADFHLPWHVTLLLIASNNKSKNRNIFFLFT